MHGRAVVLLPTGMESTVILEYSVLVRVFHVAFTLTL